MIIPEPKYLLIFIVTFFITALVMDKFLITPILKILRKREELSTEAVEEANKKREAGLETLKEVQLRLDEARRDTQSKVRDIMEKASKAEKEIVAKARESVKEEVDKIREEINKEIESARSQLLRETDELAAKIAEKILGRKVA